MAFKGTELQLGLALVLVALLFHGAVAQSGCLSALTGLTPCLSYINGNSSTPSSSCCSQLSSVVSSQPECLCLLLNGTASSYGVNVNQTLALAMPAACSVKTPPVSRCNAAVSPSSAPSPSGSPSDSSDNNTPNTTTPSTPAVPTGTASKTTPTTTATTSDGSIKEWSLCSIAFAALSASFVANIFHF